MVGEPSMRVRRHVDRAVVYGALRSQQWVSGGLALLVFMVCAGAWVLSISCHMSLVMLGAPVLLLGNLVLLVVCSGINDRFDGTSQSDAGGALRSECQRQRSPQC